MRGIRSVKAVKGALLGLTFSGGWLVADLILPEPWGDYLLYAALAVVNMMAGWYIGQLTDKKEEQAAAEPQAAVQYEGE